MLEREAGVEIGHATLEGLVKRVGELAGLVAGTAPGARSVPGEKGMGSGSSYERRIQIVDDAGLPSKPGAPNKAFN